MQAWLSMCRYLCLVLTRRIDCSQLSRSYCCGCCCCCCFNFILRWASSFNKFSRAIHMMVELYNNLLDKLWAKFEYRTLGLTFNMALRISLQLYYSWSDHCVYKKRTNTRTHKHDQRETSSCVVFVCCDARIYRYTRDCLLTRLKQSWAEMCVKQNRLVVWMMISRCSPGLLYSKCSMRSIDKGIRLCTHPMLRVHLSDASTKNTHTHTVSKKRTR